MDSPVPPEQLITICPVVSCVFSLSDGRCRYVSENLERIAGISREAFMAAPDWLEFVVDADREQARAALTSLAVQDAPFRFRLRLPSGELRWMQAEFQNLTTKAGENLLVGYLLNITGEAEKVSQLQESEEKFKAIVDSMTDTYYRTDRDGNIVLASASAEKLMGYPLAELIGRPIANYYTDPDGREKFFTAITGNGGTISGYEAALRRKDGEVVWVSTSAHVIHDINGEFDGVEGTVRDITDRKRAEIALREERDFTQAILDTVASVVSVLNRRGEIIIFNRAAEEVTGFRAEELRHQPIWDHLIPPEQRESVKAVFENLMTGNFPNTHENRWLTKTGETRLLAWSNTALTNAAGDVEFVVATGIDITDSRAAENSLEQSRKRYKTLFESAGDAIFLMKDDVFVDCNPRTLSMFGCTREQIVGQPPYRFSPELQPDGQSSEAKAISRITAAFAGEPQRFRWQHIRYDGTPFAAEVSLTRMEIDDELSLLAVVRDISEQQRSEDALRSSEERFRELTENIREVFWLVSPDWKRVLYISPAYAEVWGESPATLYEQPLDWMRPIYPDDKQKIQDFLVNANLDTVELEFPVFRIVRPDDAIRWICARAYPIRGESGAVVRVAGIAEDITERKHAEDQLRQTAVVFNNTVEGIVILDVERNIITVNQAFTDITGFSEAESRFQSLDILHAGTEGYEHGRPDWEKVYREGGWQGEIWNRRANGEIFPAWQTITTVTDESGRVENYVCVFTDITTIKQSQQKVDYLAHHDPLTGLPNRLLLNARLEHSLQYARREGEMVAVLFIDLDRFKNINDSLGHSVGDDILVSAAERLRKVVRDEDTVARLGGDEFIILMEQVKGNQDAVKLASKIMDVFQIPFSFDEHVLHVTASIGISIFPQDGVDIEGLIKNADAAMYRAKENGRDTFQFYTEELTDSVFERVLLETSLRRALEDQDFVLYYQPQISLVDGRVVGAEALIRWRHPEMGLVPPLKFIPLAEESGLIIPIGDWVLRTACQQMAKWLARGYALERIAVNISTVQIQRGNIHQSVSEAITASGLEPDRLELEITESTLMQKGHGMIAGLDSLRTLGVELSIDDFGTGYSSLSYLKQLPIDKLKIDRSFTRHVGEDANDEAIVRAVIAMGHTLQLKIVAEGVETFSQLEFLRQQSCDVVQGYYFGHPVPAEEFERYFQNPPYQFTP